MRKITSTMLTVALASGAAFAQVGEYNTKANEKEVATPEVKGKTHFRASNNKAETPIWSEDFSNGIPATWTNVGSQSNEVWEYRGPNTTPDNTEGTRGAYGAAQDPIVSPTASNGFVIFDSDFLDNAGVQGAFGQGVAPSPHNCSLTTDAIDLSNEPSVELKFNQYYRRFAGNGGSQQIPATYVAFSIDGGLTWPYLDTINADISVNSATAANDVMKINASNYIGGESNVKIRFTFDGDYYFWQIDDIELNVAPDFELQFRDYAGAPAIDLLSKESGSTKMGIVSKSGSVDQLRTMEFDANVFNYGTKGVNNIVLNVDILDDNNTLISTYSSTTPGSISMSGGYLDYNTLNTYGNPYKPTAAGNYKAVYRITSDSAAAITDTVNFFVTETQLSADFNNFDNIVTTNNLGNDGSAVAIRHDLVMPVVLEMVRVNISTNTTAGGAVEVGIYDTLDYPTTETLIASSPTSYTITATDVANGYIEVPITDGTNPYAEITNLSYFVKVTMYSNSGANEIRVWNDQTYPQPAGTKYMYNSDDATWYSGYSGSLNFNAPHVRSYISLYGVGVEEEKLLNNVTVGPNPATEFVNVNFTELEGDYTLTLMDVTGRVVANEEVRVFGNQQHTVDVSSLTAGVYMLNVNNGSASVTYKISVQ